MAKEKPLLSRVRLCQTILIRMADERRHAQLDPPNFGASSSERQAAPKSLIRKPASAVIMENYRGLRIVLGLLPPLTSERVYRKRQVRDDFARSCFLSSGGPEKSAEVSSKSCAAAADARC
jgi:hypothetical protein